MHPDDSDISSAVADYWCTISLPWEDVGSSKCRAKIKESLTNFLKNDLASLPMGNRKLKVDGVPFDLNVSKRSDLSPRIYFSRLASADPTLSTRAAEAIARKAKKLERYKSTGKTTLILVESEDIAMMNEGIMLAAIATGLQGVLPIGVDEIWYADTSIPSELLFADFTKRLANN